MKLSIKMLLSCLLIISTLLASEEMNLESMAKEIHPLFSSSHWGMHVVDSDTKQVLYTHNASQLFIPASVAKLFTTAAALEILGPSPICSIPVLRPLYYPARMELSKESSI